MGNRSLMIVLLGLTASAPAAAQGGKHACALLSAAEIKQLTGNDKVARSAGRPEESQFSSNCMYEGAIDITIHIGSQTKVMFGRERDTYAKAPARLNYKVESVSGLGEGAYTLSYSGKMEARAMVGETELVVSLSGSLPPEADARKMAVALTKAAAAKLK
jgi:hypothetical protein